MIEVGGVLERLKLWITFPWTREGGLNSLQQVCTWTRVCVPHFWRKWSLKNFFLVFCKVNNIVGSNCQTVEIKLFACLHSRKNWCVYVCSATSPPFSNFESPTVLWDSCFFSVWDCLLCLLYVFDRCFSHSATVLFFCCFFKSNTNPLSNSKRFMWCTSVKT